MCDPLKVLIFAEKKQDVDAIHEYLLLKGVEAVSIHGGKGNFHSAIFQVYFHNFHAYCCYCCWICTKWTWIAVILVYILQCSVSYFKSQLLNQETMKQVYQVYIISYSSLCCFHTIGWNTWTVLFAQYFEHNIICLDHLNNKKKACSVQPPFFDKLTYRYFCGGCVGSPNRTRRDNWSWIV